jgi:predicted RNA binding protein YcfA (HicA-like mRNA interferase family)
MTRLPVISAKRMVKLLERQGFLITRISGSHHMLRHPDGRRTAVPVHGNDDIAIDLLMKILRQVEITPDEYALLVSQP